MANHRADVIAERWDKLAANVGYKPWRKLSIRIDYDLSYWILRINLCHIVPDVASSDHSPTEVLMEDIVKLEEAADMTDEEVYAYIYDLVGAMERHEQREWFTIDGRRPAEAHPDEG